MIEGAIEQRYKRSEDMLCRAEHVIPLGTQTFSKSKTQFPFGVSPFFIERGSGSRVWDVDGNEYIDFANSLAAITLGYCDPDVDAAVVKQLSRGVIFSLPHPLEISVAEQIVEMVPCAEMVRFGKNGSDATAGAIRLARAFTSRDHVLVCGYHGWQDWYIGSTARNRGVPRSTQELTHAFPYNDISALQRLLEQYPGAIAAVILEPMNLREPDSNFLSMVREVTHDHGALLILDETVTGFRYSNGGAQDYFGVVPDLATFGKGLANGYPLSAIAGKREIMKLMEEIFFSFTFGGETLSLAAANATLLKLRNEPVLQTIAQRGEVLKSGVAKLIVDLRLGEVVTITGHPSWTFLSFHDTPTATQWQLKTLFLQEVFQRGILTLGTHNLSYAHSPEDIARLLDVYREVFTLIKRAVERGDINAQLRCAPLEPLFRLR